MPVQSVVTTFADDVRAGLLRPGQKELPSKYLYDALGSKLFEAICELPEYGVTRADQQLLETNAQAIVDALPGDVLVCELGCGNGRKTRPLLEAFTARNPTTYFPVEISPDALADCRRGLCDLPLGIVGLEGEYIEGLTKVVRRRKPGERLLVLFIGSTIGNFSAPADIEFLSDIRSLLRPGDALLLGTDLIKPINQLYPAYDDALGVTAAFNKNLLARLNRELNANFNLRYFEHVARFNDDTSSIEMHLLSDRDQTIDIPGAGLKVHFRAGETIWTENSRKYQLDDIPRMAQTARFRIAQQWLDEHWCFAETLLSVA